MKFLRRLLIALVLASSSVYAQVAPFQPNQVLTAAALNAAFANAGITAGTINGATVGLTNPKAASFTSLTATTATFGSFTFSTPVLPAKGGTGIANGAANTLTFAGNFPLTLTLSNTTNLTLPTSGVVTAQGNTVTGSGSIVLATSPTVSTPTLTGTTTINTIAPSLGTGLIVTGAVNLSSNGAVNDAKTTVASAATPDIWTSVGRVVDYTGTATATAFANAPSAGSSRELVCAAAAVFTNGANFIVAGNTNYTCTAGDRILVVAVTTSQFRLFPLKQDGTAVVTSASSGLVKNYVNNGSFAVNQIVTPTTTDNSYPLDGWRLLLGAANAATFVQDTADVPTGAGYAAKLIVGSGNNNKFGVFMPIENRDILDARGQSVSLRVPMKATAGLTDGTGKIRICVAQWTGTADSISVTPVSAWNAEGTNPTLIANWACANTPAAISVTTSWADYTLLNVSISASATNLGLMIWSDDKVNTQTTDILRIGGYVTLSPGSGAPTAMVAPFNQEYSKARRYYRKTFAYATAPANAVGANTGEFQYESSSGSSQAHASQWQFDELFKTPTITSYNPVSANAQVYDITTGIDCSSTTISNQSIRGATIKATGDVTSVARDVWGVHLTADARL